MAPRIGQAATLNGKSVLWSGENYGWQSPASHNKLKKDGKFKLGTQALDRLGNAFNNSPITQRLKGLQQDFRAATDKLGFDKVENVVNRAVKADDKLPSSRVAQGGAIAAQSITNRLGIDPRLALVGMVATGAGGGAIRRGANPRKATGVEPVSRVPQPTPPTGTTTSLGRPRNTQPATGQMRPGVNRISQVNPDGTGLAWLPAQAKGVPAVTLPNGTRVRLDQSPGKAWSLEPFTSTRRPDGSIEFDYPKANQPRKVEPVVPDPKEVLKPNPELLNRGSLNNPRPRSQAQFNEPKGPRPQRVHVDGAPGPRRMERGFEQKPLGNPDNPFPSKEEALQAGVNFNGSINMPGVRRRSNIAERRDGAAAIKARELAGKRVDKTKILNDVAWADGDPDKLKQIAESIGANGSYQHASRIEKAIKERLSKLEQNYGGSPSLTVPQRQAFNEQWNWDNYNGDTKAQREFMAEQASQRWGNREHSPAFEQRLSLKAEVERLREAGRNNPSQLRFPKPDPNFRPAELPDQQTRGGRPITKTPQRHTPATQSSDAAAVADRIQARREARQNERDAELSQSATRNMVDNHFREHRLSDAERERQRQLRRNRPLRPIEQRLNQRR